MKSLFLTATSAPDELIVLLAFSPFIVLWIYSIWKKGIRIATGRVLFWLGIVILFSWLRTIFVGEISLYPTYSVVSIFVVSVLFIILGRYLKKDRSLASKLK
ncbi:MAG: hypothetical protein R2730_05770 [Chitinophagales bacterium]